MVLTHRGTYNKTQRKAERYDALIERLKEIWIPEDPISESYRKVNKLCVELFEPEPLDWLSED